MKKIFLSILTFFASTSLVFGATNLWQFYDEQGLLFPSFEYRKDFYEQVLSDDEYRGTEKQNALYLQYLQENNFVESPKAKEIKLGAFNPAGGTTYRLQTSIGTTDTSVKLSSFKNRSSIPLTMTLLNTDIAYGTLSPQTSRSEFMSFTGITQNADGTATLTGVSRGLSDISPFTASTTLRQTHAGQSVFILSDSPQLFEEYAKRRNDETITGRWNFSTELPYSSITATTSQQFTTKQYVDNVTNAGAATSTETNGGIVELGTLAEQADSYSGGASKPTVLQTKNSTSTCQVVGSYNITASSTTGKLDKNCLDQTLNYSWSGSNTYSGTNTFTNGLLATASSTFTATTTFTGKIFGSNVINSLTASTTITGFTLPQPVYLGTTTGAVLLSDANDQDALDFVGFAITNATNGNSVYVQTSGIVSGFSGLTKGADYYVQDAAGTIGTTVGTYDIPIGVAISNTEILIQKREWNYIGSQGLSNGSNTINAPLQKARFVVVYVEVYYSSGSTYGSSKEFVLFKKGATNFIFYDHDTGTSGTADYRASVTANWSGNTITVSGSGGVTSAVFNNATAYFYK